MPEPRPGVPPPAPRWWIVAALALGVLARIAGWTLLRSAYFCGMPGFEDAVHAARAVAILAGGFPEQALPAGSPLYPHVAALGMRLAGGIPGLLAIQLLLGLAMIPLVAWTFAPLLSPRGRWIAALIYAVHPLAVFFEMRMQPTIFALLLLLPAGRLLFFAPSRRAVDAALAGLLLGIGFLLKPGLFTLVAAAGIWTQWRRPPVTGSRAGGGAGRALATAAAFLLLPALLGLHHASLPRGSALWNWTDAHAFHRSLAAPTWGTPRAQAPPVWESPVEARTHANEQMGRGLGEREIASFYAGRGLQMLAENPGRVVALLLGRAALALNGPELPDPTSARFVLGQHGPWLAWGLHLFPLLLACGLLGWLRSRESPTAPPPWPWFAAVAAAGLIGLQSAGSRWFLVVAGLPLIAAGLEGLPALGRAIGRSTRARLALTLAAGLLVVSALDLPGARARFEDPSEDLRLAASLVAGEDRGRALALLRRAQRESHRNPAARKDLGELLLREDLLESARGEFRAALEIDPGYHPALLGLAEVHRLEGGYAEADSLLTQLVALHPQHPLYLNQLAAVKMLLAQKAPSARQSATWISQARALLSRAIEIEPAYETALINLRAAGDLERRAAAAAFPEEITRQPNPELIDLGARAIQLLEQRDTAAADSLTSLGLERFPDDPLALFFRGAFFLRTSRPQEAAPLLERVVRTAPGRAMTTGAAVDALLQSGRAAQALALARESLGRAEDEDNRRRLGQIVDRLESGPPPGP